MMKMINEVNTMTTKLFAYVVKNVKIILNHSNILHCACISKGNYISLIWPLIHLKVVIDERNDSLTQIMNDLSFVPDIKFLKSFNVFETFLFNIVKHIAKSTYKALE